MTQTYECMFLIDNDVVRTGWREAKAAVAEHVTKHGGSVVTSRRWAERRLAYPIRRKNRATYLLAFCDLDPTQMNDLRRDLDISETVMRYLITNNREVPAEERELSAAESEEDFTLPEPPADDAIDAPKPAPVEEGEEGAAAPVAAPAEAKADATAEGGEAKAEAKAEGGEAKAEGGEAKTEKADAAPEAEAVPATKTEGEEA